MNRFLRKIGRRNPDAYWQKTSGTEGSLDHLIKEKNNFFFVKEPRTYSGLTDINRKQDVFLPIYATESYEILKDFAILRESQNNGRLLWTEFMDKSIFVELEALAEIYMNWEAKTSLGFCHKNSSKEYTTVDYFVRKDIADNYWNRTGPIKLPSDSQRLSSIRSDFITIGLETAVDMLKFYSLI